MVETKGLLRTKVCFLKLDELVENLLVKSVACKEAVVQRWSVKKMFLKTSQNSQENSCATVSFLIKL